VLGKADAQRWGRWLYIAQGGIPGYVYEPWFDYTLDWSTLSIIEVADLITVAPSNASRGLVISAGELKIEHVWPTYDCHAGGWTAYFEVKITGGDGRNYKLFWDLTPVSYTVKETERDVAVIQFVGNRSLFIGTVWVESGGNRVGQATSLKAPGCSN